jgi:hypothetical protein
MKQIIDEPVIFAHVAVIPAFKLQEGDKILMGRRVAEVGHIEERGAGKFAFVFYENGRDDDRAHGWIPRYETFYKVLAYKTLELSVEGDDVE